VRFQCPRLHSERAALLLLPLTQGGLAIGLEGTAKITFLWLFEEDPGVRRGKPHVEEDKPKGDAVGHRLLDQLLTHHILGHRTAPFLLLHLGVGILLGLDHQVKAHRPTHSLAALQGRQEVDAFEPPVLGVVVVPTHPIVLAGVRFLLDQVVNWLIIHDDGVGPFV
jgi:hypothetical protein